ncbi:hypothetical protein [uncultured Paraglaciecola sp.]|uniref:hypothetical protein n=1 Tax=uncultured Paraglaciecola sp. TaxID=1765024 RepID=UPI0026316D5E|nr:hypothetical protein [uncultured Paraglaciecola sp.]
MTNCKNSTIGRRNKQTDENGVTPPFDEGGDTTGRWVEPAHRDSRPKLKTKQCLVTDLETGESEIIECLDTKQLMMSIRGTAKRLDKAILNIKKSRKDQFAMTIQAKCQTATVDAGLSNADIRVWDFCKNDVMYGNEIKSTQVEIAFALRMAISTVNRSFARFRQMKMIEASGAVKGTPTYRVSDDYLVKGKRELDGTSKMTDVIYADFVNKKIAENS